MEQKPAETPPVDVSDSTLEVPQVNEAVDLIDEMIGLAMEAGDETVEVDIEDMSELRGMCRSMGKQLLRQADAQPPDARALSAIDQLGKRICVAPQVPLSSGELKRAIETDLHRNGIDATVLKGISVGASTKQEMAAKLKHMEARVVEALSRAADNDLVEEIARQHAAQVQANEEEAQRTPTKSPPSPPATPPDVPAELAPTESEKLNEFSSPASAGSECVEW